jgi:hypothetical protein
MATKKTHQKLTAGIAIASSPLILVVNPIHFGLYEIGILITLWPLMTPDLDHQARKFDWLSDFFGLKMYADMIPHRYGLKKRHWSRFRIWDIFKFSHIPFFGTFPRTVMLTWLIGLVILMFNLSFGWFLVAFFWTWVGMSVSDTGHLLLDRPWKKKQREMTPEHWIRRRKHRHDGYFRRNRRFRHY